jgi:hypothetical protein
VELASLDRQHIQVTLSKLSITICTVYVLLVTMHITSTQKPTVHCCTNYVLTLSIDLVYKILIQWKCCHKICSTTTKIKIFHRFLDFQFLIFGYSNKITTQTEKTVKDSTHYLFLMMGQLLTELYMLSICTLQDLKQL